MYIIFFLLLSAAQVLCLIAEGSLLTFERCGHIVRICVTFLFYSTWSSARLYNIIHSFLAILNLFTIACL